MTEQEAKELLEQLPVYRYEQEVQMYQHSDVFNALDMGIKALEKQIPKKVIDCEDNCEECNHFETMVDRLAYYEDLEEQGLLLRLPCKVGDKVYFTDRRYDREKREFIPFVHNGYVKAIMEHKGNLSKTKAVEIVRSIQ